MPARRVMSSSWANYFFLSIASGIFLPYLPLYLKARGMSASRIGVLLGCLELAGMAGPMLLGRMADRRAAYRGILAVSSVVPMVVMLPLELTTFYPVFVICILVMGFTYRATIPLLDSLVSRIVFDPARALRPAEGGGEHRLHHDLPSPAVHRLGRGGQLARHTHRFPRHRILRGARGYLAPPRARTSPPLARGNDCFTCAEACRALRRIRREFWAVMGVIFLGRFGIGRAIRSFPST